MCTQVMSGFDHELSSSLGLGHYSSDLGRKIITVDESGQLTHIKLVLRRNPLLSFYYDHRLGSSLIQTLAA